MTLTDRERNIARVFGIVRRRYERWMSLLLFVVSFASGVMGALFGLQAVLFVFGGVAIVVAAQIAFMLVRRLFSGDRHA